MEYEVILSAEAQEHFRRIIHYLIYELQSDQAASMVTDDMEETILRLSEVAGSLKLCEHPRLQALGYRTIHFRRHKYLCCIKMQAAKHIFSGSSMICRTMRVFFRINPWQ